MKFTVIWSNRAESRLAELWLRGDRRAITEAADRLDAELRADADTVGESRAHGRRILHAPPLGIIFTVSADDQMVIVLDAWRYEARR